MKDSAPDTTDAPATPTERPAWRFSGRRGTPVHLRERSPASLPPEIRQTVSRMAREQAGETAPAAQEAGRPGRAPTTGPLRMPGLGADRSSPPVAGAPLPVERRTGSETNATTVTTTPFESVPAPEPIPVPAFDEPVDLAPPPVEEVPAADARSAEEQPAEGTQPAAEDAPAAAEDASATPAKNSPPTAPQATAADRRKRAKARAKARAKERAKAGKGRRDGANETDAERAKRRLFARGRDVDAAVEPVSIEPALVEPAAIVEPAATAEPALPAPATPDLPEPAAPVEPAGTAGPAEPAAAVAASVEDVDLGATASGRVPVSGSAPDPKLGPDSASQAAWELGRLPILLAAASAPAPTPAPDALASAATPAPDAPASAATPDGRPRTEAALEIPAGDAPGRLQPIQWKPIGSNPRPAPIEPATPRRATPEAIARLDSLFPPRVERASRAREGDTGSVTHDVAKARQRIAQRRAELDEVVGALAELRERVPH